MAYHRKHSRGYMSRRKPVSWLPVDSRIMHPLFSFGRVKGVAKLFLEIEMILALAVVTGTFLLVLLSLLKK